MRKYKDVRNAKKALSYGVQNGMGAFRQNPSKKSMRRKASDENQPSEIRTPVNGEERGKQTDA